MGTNSTAVGIRYEIIILFLKKDLPGYLSRVIAYDPSIPIARHMIVVMAAITKLFQTLCIKEVL
jgi:hypothetical protein